MKKIMALIFLLLLPSMVLAEDIYLVSSLISDLQFSTRGDLGFDSTMWIRTINMGIQDLGTKADCGIDTQEVIVTSGTAEYALPVNFSRFWRVKLLSDESTLDIIDGSQVSKGATGFEQERLKVYSWINSSQRIMGFYPNPTQTDTVIVYYYIIPNTVSATNDTVDVVPHLHTALQAACIKAMWRRLERWDKYNNEVILMTTEINNARGWILSHPPDVEVGRRLIGRD